MSTTNEQPNGQPNGQPGAQPEEQPDRYWTFFAGIASHVVDDFASPPGYTLCQKLAQPTMRTYRPLRDVLLQTTCEICEHIALANQRREQAQQQP